MEIIICQLRQCPFTSRQGVLEKEIKQREKFSSGTVEISVGPKEAVVPKERISLNI
jgi:hypothetical protein